MLSSLLWIGGCIVSTASAQDGTIFDGLGIAGHGDVPGMREYLERYTPPMRTPAQIGAVGEMGGFTHRIPVPLPPALLSPTLALTYNQQGAGAPSRIGAGWSLTTGLSIDALTDRQWNTTYASHGDEIFRLGGGGKGLMG